MGPQYQGLDCFGGPVSTGFIQVPENIPHRYANLGDAEGSRLQVLTAAEDFHGNLPPEPDPKFRDPGYFTSPKFNWTSPAVAFDQGGICTSAGWAAGVNGAWYNVGDRTEHPSGQSPRVAAGLALIARGLAMVRKG